MGLQHKRLVGDGIAPTPAQVDEGELVVNLTDGNLYTLDENGQVKTISSGASSSGSGLHQIGEITRMSASVGTEYRTSDGSIYSQEGHTVDPTEVSDPWLTATAVVGQSVNNTTSGVDIWPLKGVDYLAGRDGASNANTRWREGDGNAVLVPMPSSFNWGRPIRCSNGVYLYTSNQSQIAQASIPFGAGNDWVNVPVVNHTGQMQHSDLAVDYDRDIQMGIGSAGGVTYAVVFEATTDPLGGVLPETFEIEGALAVSSASNGYSLAYCKGQDAWIAKQRNGGLTFYISYDIGRTWEERYQTLPSSSNTDIQATQDYFYCINPAQTTWSYTLDGDFWNSVPRFQAPTTAQENVELLPNVILSSDTLYRIRDGGVDAVDALERLGFRIATSATYVWCKWQEYPTSSWSNTRYIEQAASTNGSSAVRELDIGCGITDLGESNSSLAPYYIRVD